MTNAPLVLAEVLFQALEGAAVQWRALAVAVAGRDGEDPLGRVADHHGQLHQLPLAHP